jgi:hypothetical protein
VPSEGIAETKNARTIITGVVIRQVYGLHAFRGASGALRWWFATLKGKSLLILLFTFVGHGAMPRPGRPAELKRDRIKM